MKIRNYTADIKDKFFNPIRIEHNSKIKFLNTIHWEEDDEILIKNKDGQTFVPSEIVVHFGNGMKTFYIYVSEI